MKLDFKICFNKFDSSLANSVESHETGSLLRATGLNPTLKEISEIISWLAESSNLTWIFKTKKFILLIKLTDIERYTFEQFLKLLKSIWENKDAKSELEQAFKSIWWSQTNSLFKFSILIKNVSKAIDKEKNGYLTTEQLRAVLLSFGEKLDDEEFKELLKNITVQTDGTINNDG